MKRGMIQIYTGDGKGKTSAAIGQAVRAAGAGMRVVIIQFMKGRESAERIALKKLAPMVNVFSYGNTNFIRDGFTGDDLKEAKDGLRHTEEILTRNEADIIVLDEIFHLVHCGMIDTLSLLELIRSKPDHMEMILTGRDAPPEICNRADLVTEMISRKHYYEEGISARLGIEY